MHMSHSDHPDIVGVLALQGGYEAHEHKIHELGFDTLQVRQPKDLQEISALIIPGGESGVMLRLIDSEFWSDIVELVSGGLPTLGTCAGMILLANKVTNPSQKSLALLDITVERNAYGRQNDSFVSSDIKYSDGKLGEGVFIRAPKICNLGADVEVLATHNNQPVAVRQGNVIAASFHPELSDGISHLHEILVGQI